ncbi:MAG: HAMP domain-containing histidine kinase [Clostridia bacterium]|nr:HAMP domain-containing histidine kinase [Clostridia bacterium]
MKLVQKTFIVIFAVTLAVSTIAGTVLLSFWNKKTQENESRFAIEKLSAFADKLESHISARRDMNNSPVLTSVEFQNAVDDFFISNEEDAWLILPDGGYSGDPSYKTDSIPKNDEISVTFIKNDVAVVVCRAISFENGRNLLCLAEKTETFDRSTAAIVLFVAAFTISALSALAGALVCRGFENKLKRMNRDSLKMVGDRGVRVSGYRQPELEALASSVNATADAIADDMEKLQTIADGRKQFTDNLAHEMKTPLTSILGFADILRIRRSLDDKARMEYANIIFEEARRMRGLSGKLLELATAGNTKLDFESVSIPAFFDEIRISVLPLLAPRSISLKVFPAPVQIKIDRELFKSLIYNLIENAAKASPDGSEIRLVCEATPETVKISVSDNGCGMTPDQIRRAAEPFYMADKSRSRKAGGAGLGLALCAEIAEKHRARLVIKSKPGKGTTVTLIMLTILAQEPGGITNEDKTKP